VVGPPADLIDGPLSLLTKPPRVVVTALALELGRFRPPRQGEAAIATARPFSAKARLKQDHGETRVGFQEVQSGPQTNEPATDDADIGPRGPV
jgi:hypothetical protein